MIEKALCILSWAIAVCGFGILALAIYELRNNGD